jgi:thioredoxin 2
MADARIDRTGIIMTCSNCGRANRRAFGALTKAARCGQCQTALAAPATPVEVDDAAGFDAAMTHSTLPLLVDFWAPWCGPCRTVAPELERVARANAGRYVVVKVNTEVHQDIAARFRIQSIPTLALIFEGQEIERVSGARPASDIEAFAQQALAARQRRAS